jgi:hypothetical protein
VRVAKGSLTETHNHLRDGVQRRHWSESDIEDLLLLAVRARCATTGWLRHLTTTDTPPSRWDQPNPRRSSRQRRRKMRKT